MSSSPLVLVVDDHPDTVEMLDLYLTENGCRVLTALNGPDAIEIAERERPSVVLLDIHMPRVTGLDVARKLREPGFLPGVRIVATTGRAGEAEQRLALENGFDQVMTKPYDMNEILALVRGS